MSSPRRESVDQMAVKSPFAIRMLTASRMARDSGRGSTGRYVRSRSTDRRGMLRMNRLMAVPPLRAEANLLRDMRYRPDEQRGLLVVDVTERHPCPPAR